MEYHEIIASEDFITFQEQVLVDYYGEQYFTEVLGKKVASFIMEGKDIKYPFREMCRGIKDTKAIVYDNYYSGFKKVVEGQIINNTGLMMDHLVLDEECRVCSFNASLGKYRDNVYSTQVMEYELAEAFVRYKTEGVTPKLEIRDKIHHGHDIKEVLTTGCNRTSLIGVQVLFIVNKKVVIAKRSNNVIQKRGFYQFVPAGGMELVDNCNETIVVETIFKEMTEEGEYRTDNRDRERIEQLINKGDARIYFLGNIVGLSNLTSELSFVIEIDDFDINSLKNNSESVSLEKLTFREVESLIRKESKICSPSVALWELYNRKK